MAKKRIKACWLLLLVLLYTANILLSIGETQARYENTIGTSTLLESQSVGVTSNCLVTENDAPLTVLVGELDMYNATKVSFWLKSSGADASGKLTWGVSDSEHARYLKVSMQSGADVIEPDMEIDLLKDVYMDISMILTPTEFARTTVHEMMKINVLVTWGNEMWGTFQVILPEVEPESTEEETEPEEDPSEEDSTAPTTDEEEDDITDDEADTDLSDLVPDEDIWPVDIQKGITAEKTGASGQKTVSAAGSMIMASAGSMLAGRAMPLAARPAATAAIKSVNELIAALTGKASAEQATEPAAETEHVTDPETEPSTEPETEPVTEPETEPATEPGTEPVTEPETEPATEPPVQPDPEPDPEEESKDPIRLETISSFDPAEQLPVKIVLTKDVTSVCVGFGTVKKDEAEDPEDTEDSEEVADPEDPENPEKPAMNLIAFPDYTKFSLNEGESYYMMYNGYIAEFALKDVTTLYLLLDFSYAELAKNKDLLLAMEAYGGEELLASCQVLTTPDASESFRTTVLSSNQVFDGQAGVEQLQTLEAEELETVGQLDTEACRILSQNNALELSLPEEWMKAQLEYSVELLTMTEEKTLKYVPVTLSEEGLSAEYTNEQKEHKLVLSIGEKLPRAGTYRINMSWSYEGVCYAHTQTTFFINYSAYTEYTLGG